MRRVSERKCAVVEWADELWKEGEKERDETNGNIHVHIYIYTEWFVWNAYTSK